MDADERTPTARRSIGGQPPDQPPTTAEPTAEPESRAALRLTCGAAVCGIAAATIGSVALVGWATGNYSLASVRPDYMPVSPATAVSLVFAGLSVAALTLASPRCEIAVRASAAAVTLLMALRVSELVTGMNLHAGLLFFPSPPPQAVPAGHVAVPTVIAVLFAAFALLLVTRQHHAPRLGTAFGLALGVAVIGLGFALGYAYGRPLLYGGTAIPMALLTAIGLLALGGGLALEIAARDAAARALLRSSLREHQLQRDRQAAAIAEQRNLLEAVLQCAPTSVVVYDGSGRVVHTNQRARDFMGWGDVDVDRGVEAIVGAVAPHWPSGEPVALEEAPGYRALHGETVHNTVEIVTRRDGAQVWMSFSAAPLYDSAGTPNGAVVTSTDITDLKIAEDELRQHRDHLETLVEQATADLQITNAQLQITNTQLQVTNVQLAQSERDLATHQERLRVLAGELARAEQRERQRIATGLHDDILQVLAVVKMRLQLAAVAGSPDEAQGTCRDVEALLGGVIRDARELLMELRPPVLSELGLAEAVRWAVGRASTIYRFEACASVEGEVRRLAEDTETMLFQAVKELLSNASKHAQARQVGVTIRYRPADVQIQVIDDGRGFSAEPDQPSETGGFGLLNIRERLAYLGGTLCVESSQGNGACCTMVVPG